MRPLLLGLFLVACSGTDIAGAESALGSAGVDGCSWARSIDERRGSVPIDDHATWHVIYSVPVHDLAPDERLAVRGEVQLTVCEASDLDKSTPCLRITPFTPTYKAKIVLGDSPDDASGKDLSATSDIDCNPTRHHCAVAVGEKITSGWHGSKNVNLVVSAEDPHAGGNDLMIVNKGDGGVFVTRIGPKAAHATSFGGHEAETGWMKLDKENDHPRRPHVTLQAKVHGTNGGDVIDVDAIVEAVTHGSGPKPAGCDGARDPLVTNEVYVSTHEGDPIGSKISMVSPKNGKNCVIGETCDYRKSASFQLPNDVPSEVWVSVVSWGGRSCSAPDDEWRLGGKSALRVGLRAQP